MNEKRIFKEKALGVFVDSDDVIIQIRHCPLCNREIVVARRYTQGETILKRLKPFEKMEVACWDCLSPEGQVSTIGLLPQLKITAMKREGEKEWTKYKG